MREKAGVLETAGVREKAGLSELMDQQRCPGKPGLSTAGLLDKANPSKSLRQG